MRWLPPWKVSWRGGCGSRAAGSDGPSPCTTASAKVERRRQVTAVVERDRAGYVATWPQLQGCYSQGRTYEEVVRNIRDAIRLHLEDRLALGEALPVPREALRKDFGPDSDVDLLRHCGLVVLRLARFIHEDCVFAHHRPQDRDRFVAITRHRLISSAPQSHGRLDLPR